MSNLAELAAARAAESPDAPAIIEPRAGEAFTISFRELERASARAAALLHQSGLRPGEAVLVFLPISIDLYAALWGIFRAGLTAMFLDPSAGRRHIENCCALLPPRALLAGPKAHLLRLISPAVRRIPVKFVAGFPLPGATRWSRADALPPRPGVEPVAADAPALITFTSGSTGAPKAAVRTHGFLAAQHRVLERTLGARPGRVDLPTLPIFVLSNLASGVTSVIPEADLRAPGAVDPKPMLAQIARHRPQTTTASPAFLERLADAALSRNDRWPSFTHIFTGGGPVFPRVMDKLAAVAPNAEIVAVYGSTEAEPIAHTARHELSAGDFAAVAGGAGLPAGTPVPEIAVRILPNRFGAPIGPFTAAEFAAQVLAAGEAGEIVVSGGHVLTGYLHGRGDAETKFRVDGTVWHRTGDAGRFDERGRLWLLGRCDAVIRDGGGVLYPFTVECAAYHHAGVRRAAAIGHNGRRRLIVELAEGAAGDTVERVRAATGWADLHSVDVWKSIPVDARHNAKIDYPALRKRLA